MGDAFTSYETGLSLLLKRLGHDHPRYTEALTLQSRLLENLARGRLYGDTETSRAERAQILYALNRLALETMGKSFNELVQEPEAVDIDHRWRELERSRRSEDRAAEEAALANLASAHAVQGDFQRASEYYKQAVTVARELGHRQAEGIYLQELGLVLLRLDDADRAANAFQKALNLFEAIEADPLLRARTKYHLGRCYHQLGRWREAIELLELARDVFSRHKVRLELAHAMLELGQLYNLIQDFESAYIYFKDALRLFRRLGDTDGVAVTQEALGSLALQTARLPEAITSLQEARQGYASLRRNERVRAVDDLLRIAHQACQTVEGTIP